MEREIFFNSDRYRLHGILHLPDEKKPPVVIGSHGLLSSGDSPKQIALAKECNANGIAYFRFDHRGCGKSSGEFSSATTFEARCTDLIRAVETMREQFEIQDRMALFGSSFGGAVSLGVWHLFNIKAIVTVAAPVSLSSINPQGISNNADMARVKSLSKEQLFFNIEDQLPAISDILIFHGDQDKIVPFSNAQEIYQKTKAPKKLIQQSNGDHIMSDPQHQADFVLLAVKWFRDRLII